MEMQRRGYHSLSLPVRRGEANANANANEPAARAGDDTNCDHFVDAQDFRNMRLAIGTVERNIFEMSLSDNLTGGTRHIDIHLRQNMAPAGNITGQEQAAAEPGEGSSRLKITVAAEEPEPDADKEYLDNMRGWLMTVATLFVGITFQATIQQPQWNDEDGNTSASGPAAAAPSPLSAAQQRATNKSTGESWRRTLYLYSNAMAFVLAMSLLLVLVLMRGTSTATRAVGLITYTMPSLFLVVALTFSVAMTTDWKRVVYFVLVEGAYAAFVVALMLGKLGGCARSLLWLFGRRR
ncbi:unnamed protein product [Urochloa humidicola]